MLISVGDNSTMSLALWCRAAAHRPRVVES